MDPECSALGSASADNGSGGGITMGPDGHVDESPANFNAGARETIGGAALPFQTVKECRWLSFFRDSHTSLAVIAVTFSPNDSVAPVYARRGRRRQHRPQLLCSALQLGNR